MSTDGRTDNRTDNRTDSRLGNIGSILNGGAQRPRLVPQLPDGAEAPDPATPATEPPATQPAATAANRPKGQQRTTRLSDVSATRTRRPSAGRDVVHRVPVRLDVSLRARLDQAVRETESTLTEVTFDAIEAAHLSGNLAQLVELDAAKPTPTQRPAGSLFTRPQGREPAAPHVVTEFRFAADDLKTLDRLVNESGSASRAQLIKVALRNHLAI